MFEFVLNTASSNTQGFSQSNYERNKIIKT